MGIILWISLKLNFTPNTLGTHGLNISNLYSQHSKSNLSSRWKRWNFFGGREVVWLTTPKSQLIMQKSTDDVQANNIPSSLNE